MCIIVIKPKGAAFPPIEHIESSIFQNPHGFSMVWNQDGHLHNYKTMERTSIMKKYAELSSSLDPQTTGLIFHARYATHGSKAVKNCHCWIQNGIGFAHNGVLYNIPVHDDRTDSETYFTDYFMPAFSKLGWEYAEKISSVIIGSSKFAFIDHKGDIRTMGHYIDENGCLYSNGSYQSFRFKSLSTMSKKPSPAIHRQRMKQSVDEVTEDDLSIFGPAMVPTTDRDWDFEI